MYRIVGQPLERRASYRTFLLKPHVAFALILYRIVTQPLEPFEAPHCVRIVSAGQLLERRASSLSLEVPHCSHSGVARAAKREIFLLIMTYELPAFSSTTLCSHCIVGQPLERRASSLPLEVPQFTRASLFGLAVDVVDEHTGVARDARHVERREARDILAYDVRLSASVLGGLRARTS